MYFIYTLLLITLICACGGPQSSQMKGLAPQSKTQIVDVLKGLSAPQILSLKYGGEQGFVEVRCELIQSAKLQSKILPAPNLPVQQPSSDKFIYRLNSQLLADPELSQSVEVRLANADESVELAIKFKPIYFLDLLNLSYDSARYILQYTPVLEYELSYRIMSGSAEQQGFGTGRLLEKIDHTVTLGSRIGSVRSLQHLFCRMETAPNQVDLLLYEEFRRQWTCVGCVNTPVLPSL